MCVCALFLKAIAIILTANVPLSRSAPDIVLSELISLPGQIPDVLQVWNYDPLLMSCSAGGREEINVKHRAHPM